jgi:predicted nucleic acid-binding protein
VTRQTLENALPEGHRILLDSSLLISYFDGRERTTPVAREIVDTFVQGGRNRALVSAVTAMEVLVGPLRMGPPANMHVQAFLTAWPSLTVVPVDLAVAQTAATVRAIHRLKPVDALIVATGIIFQVHSLVTNDGAWKRVGPGLIQVVCLEDHLPFT